MKQLLILAERGTGKTTIASAFIRLSSAKTYADCDVDAPNLHLITNQVTQAKIRLLRFTKGRDRFKSVY